MKIRDVVLDARFAQADEISEFCRLLRAVGAENLGVCGVPGTIIDDLHQIDSEIIGLVDEDEWTWASRLLNLEPDEEEKAETGKDDGVATNRDVAEERSYLCGALSVSAVRLSATRHSVRRFQSVADEIESLFRRYGVRRFRLLGLESEIHHPQIVAWSYRFMREISQRELQIEVVPRIAPSALDPDWLISARTMGLRSFQLSVPWRDFHRGGQFNSKSKVIDLARELNFRMFFDWVVMTSGATIQDLGRDFAALRDELPELRVGDSLGRWGFGLEPIYGSLRIAGISEATPFYDPQVGEFSRFIEALSYRSIDPIYIAVRELVWASIAFCRDSSHRLGRLIEGQVERILEVIERPIVDLLYETCHCFERSGGRVSDQVLDRADSAFAAAMSHLDRVLELIEDRDLPWILRYHRFESSLWVMSSRQAHEMSLNPALWDLPSLLNRMPRAVIRSRLSHVEGARELTEELVGIARDDTRDRLFHLPTGESPSAVVEDFT